MKQSDRVKLIFSRNWNLPGKSRFVKWLKPSAEINNSFKNGITWLKDENIAIYTSVDNYIEHFILTNGDYENEIYKLINVCLKPGFVAFDIGANIGIQSIRMSTCVGPAGKVFSFEPINYLQNKFRQNARLNSCDNITLFPMALSDNETTITVNIDQQIWNQGTFSLGGKITDGDPQEITVKVADNVEQIKTVERLDLVKIDVEGFEFHVLRGLKQTLLKHKPRIIFEYNRNYWDRTEQKLSDCLLFLKGLNYTIYRITEVGCQLLNDPNNIVGEDNLFCIPE